MRYRLRRCVKPVTHLINNGGPARGGSMASHATDTTIHDIARRLNVSSTTVWRALNGRPRVSPRTKQLILDEVARTGYRPSLVAQNLSSGRTQTLGVVVPTIANSVYAALVRAVEQAAFDRGYSIILCDTDFNFDREQQYVDLLMRRRVEGVLLIPFAKGTAADETHLSRLARAGINVVCMQQRLPDSNLPQVAPDNFGAARDMTRHLIQLGHRRIAFFHGGLPPWYVSMCERYEGYRAALAEAGLEEDPRLVVEAGSFESILVGEEGAFYSDRVTALLGSDDRPTAVFAPVDVLAIKVMAAIGALGMRVPEDVAVAGFDDIKMSAYTDPPLTTVRHPSSAVGGRAAELLFERLAGGDDGATAGAGAGPERVPCELVIRRSCGASKHHVEAIDQAPRGQAPGG